MSQPARAVFALCKLKAIPLQVVEIRLGKKQINPMMKVPAIEDTQETNFSLGQSHAIMRYLCLKYNNNRNDLYPINDLIQTAKIDEYLDFHHTNTRRLTHYISSTVFATRLKTFDLSYDVQKGKKDVESILKNINEIYLKKSSYLCGQMATIADLSAYFEIHFLSLVDYNFQKWDKLSPWMKRVGQIKEVKEANQVFLKMLPKMMNLNFKI